MDINTIFPWEAQAGYDFVVAGSGFGSLFFLHRALARDRRRGLRVLILEWGPLARHEWQVRANSNSPMKPNETFVNLTPQKPWNFTIGLGGGTNCWGANAPRFHPNDFKVRSLYGVSRDWPYSYEALEPYYMDAERIMEIAGDDDVTRVIPRSGPFPQTMHRLSSADRALKQAMPHAHFGSASGRRVTTKNSRGACCARGTCPICPTNSKFTMENGMAELMADPRVSVVLGAQVVALETAAGRVSAVVYGHQGVEYRVSGETVVLGANAIHSPYILMKSGVDHPLLGRGLHEKAAMFVEVQLNGMIGMDGGTFNPGVNYALYDGDHRRESGAVLISTQSHWTFGLRLERGRWFESTTLVISSEELPNDLNRVTAGASGPEVAHGSISSYAEKGLDRAMQELPGLLSALPVERIIHHGPALTQSHLQGTVRMGVDPNQSIVDGDQIHHLLRNLVVVGSAVFPSCSASNPSLTVAATSLRAADRYLRSGA